MQPVINKILILIILLFIFPFCLCNCSTPQSDLKNRMILRGKRLPLNAMIRFSETQRRQFTFYSYTGWLRNEQPLILGIKFDVINELQKLYKKQFENIFTNVELSNNKNNFDSDVIIDVIIKNITISNTEDDPYTIKSNILHEIRLCDTEYNTIYRQEFNGRADYHTNSLTTANPVTMILDFGLTIGTLGVSDSPVKKAHFSSGFKSALKKSCINTFDSIYNSIISSAKIERFAEAAHEKNTAPSRLIVNTSFRDKESFLPNNTVDPGEQSFVDAIVINKGKGTAFDVNLNMMTSYNGLKFPAISKIGNIMPGEVKTVSIPVRAEINLSKGLIPFKIIAKEKRGYDSRPIELQVPAAKLRSPELLFASCNINDSSGLADGDGDGVPENNEVIELNPYVSNKGKGDALKISVKLTKITEGIEILKNNDELPRIGPGAMGKSTLAFKIPRTFAQPEIKYTICATDIRGITTEKNFSIPFTPSKPTLKSTCQVFANNGKGVPGLENGKAFLLKITASNNGNNLAKNIKLNLTSTAPQVKINSYNSHIGNLKTNESTGPISIPFSIDRSCGESTITFTAELKQDDFPSLTDKIIFPVIVRQPNIEYETVLINGVGKHGVMQNSFPTFRVSVRNKGTLPAENVIINFKTSHPDVEYDKTEQVGVIKPGEGKYKDFSFFLRGDADLKDLSISVEITQSDFENKKERLVFKVKPQTVLVQKIVGTNNTSTPTSSQPFAMPPQIYINSPNKNETTYSEIIDFKGNALAVGQGNAIEDMSVTLNKQKVQIIPYSDTIRQKPGRLMQEYVDNKLIFKGQIALKPNVNEIKVKCFDRNNNETEEVVTVVRKARLGDIYAVVIGVSHFANEAFNLDYASSDAQKFYNYLKTETGGKIPLDRMKLLLNEKANRAAIIKELTNFLGKAGPEDMVEIYLATHGVIGNDGALYYLAHNSEMDNLRGTAFSTSDLENIVKDIIQAGKVIIFLDACHSGQSGLSEMYARRSIAVHEVNQGNNNLTAQLSKYAKGVATFSASSAMGFSNEGNEWNGGVFTYHLLKGLRGEANQNDDSWITINELDNYLTSEVVVDTQGNQRPNEFDAFR